MPTPASEQKSATLGASDEESYPGVPLSCRARRVEISHEGDRAADVGVRRTIAARPRPGVLPDAPPKTSTEESFGAHSRQAAMRMLRAGASRNSAYPGNLPSNNRGGVSRGARLQDHRRARLATRKTGYARSIVDLG